MLRFENGARLLTFGSSDWRARGMVFFGYNLFVAISIRFEFRTINNGFLAATQYHRIVEHF